YHKEGIDLEALKAVKEIGRKSLSEYLKLCPDAEYIPVSKYPEGGHACLHVKCDCAFPSATQNELTLVDAKALVKNGCRLVNEGANMPTTPEAIEYLMANNVLYSPGKAANAGGVATSQLEMEQNASMGNWSFAEVDTKLQGIMKNIFDLSFETAEEFGEKNNIMMGANIAGFRKVADSMLDQGAV
ncbi:MAG: NADP-specific glutamate dehydrogenase, partial [Campylobacteraceae bacterium]|nr:NADP-specific glutamate dehydrogenase [Campylobacteraceae bacterium]